MGLSIFDWKGYSAEMGMDAEEFKRRTMQVGLRVIRLVETLPKDMSTQVIGRQLVRSATSVGANYRAACRAKSRVDMLAKLGIVEEESDETVYWLEMLVEAGLVPRLKLADLIAEVSEIVALTVASRKTLRGNVERSRA